MVRHEAAEALGGIGTPEVLPHITEWMNREDSPQVVRESCQVAVDMWEVSLQFGISTPRLRANWIDSITFTLPARELRRLSVCEWS